jgi:hypothetical protein
MALYSRNMTWIQIKLTVTILYGIVTEIYIDEMKDEGMYILWNVVVSMLGATVLDQ